jgi:hypothetical protein
MPFWTSRNMRRRKDAVFMQETARNPTYILLDFNTVQPSRWVPTFQRIYCCLQGRIGSNLESLWLWRNRLWSIRVADQRQRWGKGDEAWIV